MDSMERWEFIDGYDHKYLISDRGRVLSLATEYPRIIKQILDKRGGYYYVKLNNREQYDQLYVHRLVAKAFIPNPNNYPIINHKNEIRVDNRAENLEWCTYQYNSEYSAYKLRRPAKKYTSTGEHHILVEKSTGYLIVQWRDYDMEEGKPKTHKKRFETIEEAIEFRDEVFRYL